MKHDYSDLMPFATPRQAEILRALEREGTYKKAAKVIGCHFGQVGNTLHIVKKKAAAQGYSPSHDMTHAAPDGFNVQSVSTLYDADGELKSQRVLMKKAAQAKFELLAAAVQDIAEPFKGLAKKKKKPRHCNSDLLAVYPMGDPHIGLYAWAQEASEDFDLDIAEADLVEATDQLVGLMPAAKEALIVNLGDFFHSDTQDNRTARSGNALDVDTRWSRVLSVGVRIMRRCIDKALEKHELVTVICEIGNHDDHTAIMLAICLDNYYANEPRCVIDTSPMQFHYYRFGEVLIGTTHGDRFKIDRLPALMACDKKEDWGQTTYRHWYTGHVHHDSLKELPGCTVETFRTLAAKDAWHHGQGYRAHRDMKADLYHREFGRICRHSVGIPQIRKALTAKNK